jgi:hypothetical protein
MKEGPMSLFGLPVSDVDLTELQLGIEFFTKPSEASTEADRITNLQKSTVYSYASQLLDINISFSQVAMAVDSLMFGVTDNIAELTKLATVVLPPQVVNANTQGLNPTVYAAQALGLGLASGNGTSQAFATYFGSLSAPEFASAAAIITGINSDAIEGWVSNWISFYDANPSAHQGLSTTLAAYGAAFGDAVGTALLNPTFNGTIALLDSEVQSALIDNAEGRYHPGIGLIAEPPHLPLQGEAVLIPNAGGAIDWVPVRGAGNYAQFVAGTQGADLIINNAPSTTFTVDTQHYGNGANAVEVNAVGGHGNLLTLILGDSTAGDNLGEARLDQYSTAHIIVANGQDQIAQLSAGSDLVISGTGSLFLGTVNGGAGGPFTQAITDTGVSLEIGLTAATMINAADAPELIMLAPSIQFPTGVTAGGVTVVGGTGPGNILQGSFSMPGSNVTFSNGTTGTGLSLPVGSDKFIGGSGGGDLIHGDGGPDTIALPPHPLSDTVVFGEIGLPGQPSDVLAITDGMDVAYPGSWGANATIIAIPALFPGITGGTSDDMTKIIGLRTGPGGDVLEFKVAAWNGATSAVFASNGDLVVLNGHSVVQPGVSHLSAVWIDSGSSSSLNASDNVLLYAPSAASVQNAQQLASQLHTALNAVTLPGAVLTSRDEHILVAYDAGNNQVNIADVDLVNMSPSAQSSTANLQVYASDMASLVGVSLASLSTANIQFI